MVSSVLLTQCAKRRNEIKRDEPKLKFIIKGAKKLKQKRQKTAGEDNEIEARKIWQKGALKPDNLHPNVCGCKGERKLHLQYKKERGRARENDMIDKYQ